MSQRIDTRLLLVRHGETEWNATGKLQGSRDIPLNDRGVSQAKSLAVALAPRLGANARIVSSTLKRAAATAQEIADVTGLEVAFDERFVERDYGEWEGLTSAERAARDPELAAVWASGLEPAVPGYEYHAQLAARMRAGIDEHLGAGHASPDSKGAEHTRAGSLRADRTSPEPLVVVSHGSAIRIAIHDLLGMDLTPAVIGNLPNTAWSELGYREDCTWVLLHHGVQA